MNTSSKQQTEDFGKRTFGFGVRCVRLFEQLPKGMVPETLGKQLIRSATSVGANYRAAVRSRSRMEFVSKMGIVEEECDETIYWIEMLTELGLVKKPRVASLLDEANQILAISVASIRTARQKAKLNSI